jgi:hypothetical protein
LFNVKLFFSLLILFTFIGCLKSRAQSIHNDNRTPIETHADLGFMAILGGDMQYHLNGQKIIHYKDFKNLIYPLRDPEASQLIRNAESTDLASWLILTTGVALSADIALFYKPAVIFNANVPDRIMTGLVTVQIGLGVYFIVHNIAEGRKYNAVQRYNHLLVKKPEESSFELNPKIYTSSNGLVLGGQLSF